jgi:hypothetical protein
VWHDNAQPHTSAHTREALQDPEFEVLSYPAYILGLAPSNLCLFGPLNGEGSDAWLASHSSQVAFF